MIRNLLFSLWLLFSTTIPQTQFRAPYPVDPATMLPKAVDQSGGNKFCNIAGSVVTNGITQLDCTFSSSQALTGYTIGMIVTLYTTVSGSENAVDIDQLGPISVMDLQTGTQFVPLVTNQPHLLYYDGNSFRLMI